MAPLVGAGRVDLGHAPSFVRSGKVLPSALVGGSNELTSHASRSPGSRDYLGGEICLPVLPVDDAATSADAANLLRKYPHDGGPNEFRGKPQVWLAGPDSGIV